jgi:acetyltransferase-like isoleucine patch superfamily enzyme
MNARQRILERLLTWFIVRKLLGRRGRLAGWRALGASIGDEVYIGPRTSVRSPWNLTVGDGSRLDAVAIEAWGAVRIGRDVMIGADVSLLTGDHDIDSPTLEGLVRPIEIGDHAWLPQNIRVLPGVTIGRCAVVGTGAVVTKDVPEFAVVAGNPATVVKQRARIEYTYRASSVGTAAVEPERPIGNELRTPR